MFKEAVWIGIPDLELKKWGILHGDINGRFAYFRLESMINEKAKLELTITANARYRLWINEKPILSGPCKGDRYRHYYDEIDVSPYLRKGKNVFAVQVLACDANSVFNQQKDERLPLIAVAGIPSLPRLAIEGQLLSSNDKYLGEITSGSADWKVYLDGSYYLKAKEILINMGAVAEEINFNEIPSGWKKESFSSANWAIPALNENVVTSAFRKREGFIDNYPIREREIPLMYEKEDTFVRDLYGSTLCDQESICIEAGEKKDFLLDAGVLKNGYLSYQFNGGKNTKIKFTYFEKFIGDKNNSGRTDFENGKIEGIEDTIILNGEKIICEPFWYRTFRYIKIHVNAGEESMQIFPPIYHKTGYPLEVITEIRSSDKRLDDLWEISVRTLEGCMMETYMDCPFYEQMQFVMDTRLQALFTYALSNDIHLAKKALSDFHHSMTPFGLIQGKYPSAFPQIISTFSLHYIYMLYDYYMQTGDIEIIKQYRSDIDSILNYYDNKVSDRGLVEKLGYWEFVDWQKEWKENSGVPDAAVADASTIINLMYSYALLCAAHLLEKSGRVHIAQEYRIRQQKIIQMVEQLCWSKSEGLYREGPVTEQYTQHAQAWAVLNNMLPKKKAQKVLKYALEKEDIIKCSFATSYELFRALEKSDMYNETFNLLERWLELPEKGCTTCPEEPENSRSECHAWSALPIYEIIRGIVGIQMKDSAWESALIKPDMGSLSEIQGKVVTPKGVIEFHYIKTEAKICYMIHIPDTLPTELLVSDGVVRQLKPGNNELYIDLQ